VVAEGVRGRWIVDEERLDRARAEFRERMRHDQEVGPGSQSGHVHSHVHPESVEELYYTLAREELAARHDVLAEEGRRIFSLNREESMLYLQLAQIYLDELRRRETLRQGERMERLTRSINLLTGVITGATIIGVVLTGVGLFFGG
jgi:hypothetical protein